MGEANKHEVLTQLQAEAGTQDTPQNQERSAREKVRDRRWRRGSYCRLGAGQEDARIGVVKDNGMRCKSRGWGIDMNSQFVSEF